MTCPAKSYNVAGSTNCLVLPEGIKQYNMISSASKAAAIVTILLIMLMILFLSLFIIRSNKNDDNLSLVNEKDDKSHESTKELKANQ